MKNQCKFSIVLTAILSQSLTSVVAAEPYDLDVAAYVWPAYHPAPRWAELGIFKAGKGEWQSVWEATKRRPDDIWGARPIWGYTNEADPVDVSQKIFAAVGAGVNVFIYDWYWYGGRPFLEDALDKGFLHAHNRGKMKFYIMWANHDVNKYWDNTVDTKHGKEDTVWSAKITDDDWRKMVARWIKLYFSCPNYYCIDGKPVLMIYRLDSFVEWEGMAKAKERLDYLRTEMKKAGFPGIHLQGKIRGKLPDYRSLGVDSYTLYNWNDCHWWDIVDPVTKKDPEYAACGEYALKRCDEMNAEAAAQGAAFFPNISIGWDNNARFPISQTNRTIRGANPKDYETSARKIRDWAVKNVRPGMPRLITLNSWNEWTEGGYLEPDTRWGFGYLDATRRVFMDGRVWVEREISYVASGDSNRLQRCKLDLKIPGGRTGFSTVVWLHGGGLVGGRRHFVPFADQSIAQVAVDYRLLSKSNGLQGADCIADAAEAVAWTLRHISEYGGDPKKVFLSGLSAGAYLTMMVGMDPKYLAVHGFKPMDLAGLAPVSGQATAHFNVRKFSGDKDSQYLPKIDDLSALAHVGKHFPKIVSICGQPPYEWKCRSDENRLLISSCTALGHPWARYVELPFCDHERAYWAGVPYVELFVKCRLP